MKAWHAEYPAQKQTANISFHCTAVFLLNYSSLRDPAKEKTCRLSNHHAPEKE